MLKRSLTPLVLWPIGLYVVAMALIGAFVTHPPLSGWLGLAFLGVVLLGFGIGFVVFMSHMRTNAGRIHPHEGAVHRLLVVSDADIEPDELVSAVKLRVMGRHAEVRVVAPIMASPLHFIVEDEGAEREVARARLQESIHALAEAGIVAQGVIGTDDPLQAIGDALARFRADELLFVAAMPARRTWLDRDVERKARDLYGVASSTLYGSPAPAHALAVAA